MKKSGFKEKVFEVVSRIPKGEVMTYKEVARKAGRPRAWRAVGNILNKNPNTKKVPCHRVIRSDDRIGGYAKGPKAKIAILKKEGVKIIKHKIVS
ncbi:MAG: MGMT family protein [Patescibacteria group bacterium]|mgnify:CR=1 FL=1